MALFGGVHPKYLIKSPYFQSLHIKTANVSKMAYTVSRFYSIICVQVHVPMPMEIVQFHSDQPALNIECKDISDCVKSLQVHKDGTKTLVVMSSPLLNTQILSTSATVRVYNKIKIRLRGVFSVLGANIENC